MTQTTTNWPFPIVNGHRTPESQALLDTKRHVSNVEREIKEDLAQMEDAPF